MADTTTTTTAPAEKAPFDFAAYKAAANEGKPTPAAAATAESTPAKPAAAGKEDEKPAPGQPAAKTSNEEEAPAKVPRSVRRELNRLRNLAGQLEGRLQAYQELAAKGTQQGAPAPQKAAPQAPKREDFASDIEYLDAALEFKLKAHNEAQQQLRAAEQQDEITAEELKRYAAKFDEDVKQYSDWDEVVEAMEDVELDAEAQQTFIGLVAHCENRAGVMYYLGKNREELDKILTAPPHRQIRMFHQLEGRLAAGATSQVKSEQATQAASASAKTTEPAKTTTPAGSSDATKPKPSAAVGAQGGSASDGKPGMMLADGKTLNPAWLAMRNEAEGVRR